MRALYSEFLFALFQFYTYEVRPFAEFSMML